MNLIFPKKFHIRMKLQLGISKFLCNCKQVKLALIENSNYWDPDSSFMQYQSNLRVFIRVRRLRVDKIIISY